MITKLIPYPRKVLGGETSVTLKCTYKAIDDFSCAAQTLCDFAKRIHKLDFTSARCRPAISFKKDAKLPSEAYTLSVSDSSVIICASDDLGAQNAVSTLIQLMRAADGGFSIPVCEISDAPESSYRGVMVDLARDWHKPHVLFEYVDMCRFYKIKYLHLHFTDDQSYTIPAPSFPKLATEGRSYSAEEINELMAYAKLRGISIIPEIDVPGHCSSFANAYGEIFGTDGIICLSEESMKGMERIFSDLCDLFADSEYIHVGGDEAAIAKWTDCPKCLEAARAEGIDTDAISKEELAEIMYAKFVQRMCAAVLAKGKTPIVWEGFAKQVNHLVSRDIVVMSWENFYQTTPDLLDAGFKIINCSWIPMYIVTPGCHWTRAEIYNWNIFKWRAMHPQSPYHTDDLIIEPCDAVLGGQLLAWGDHIVTDFENVDDGVRAEQKLIEERVPMLSENTWSKEKRCDYDEFESRCSEVEALYAELIATRK